MTPTLDDLRRYAAARTLFPPTTLLRAIERLGFVQADPIRAPARAQDLILRHRVRNYRAGDLERRYARLPIEEDFFINYGFLPRSTQVLMHPRSSFRTPLTASHRKRAQSVLDFIRDKAAVHPRRIDELFAPRKVINAWGGTSNATTRLLDLMHFRGMLRVAKRVNGTRVYSAHHHPTQPAQQDAGDAPLDALIDVIVRTYAPLPKKTLHVFVRRLAIGAPQWRGDIPAALQRAKERLVHARVADIDWYWPAPEDPRSYPDADPDRVRLLTPFDPIVADRLRFEALWGWVYRFEAYTPPAKRKLGYYALPLLWRDHIVGWGNVRVEEGDIVADFGYVAGHAPSDDSFTNGLAAELERMRYFLALS
jgi:hypothetical protein